MDLDTLIPESNCNTRKVRLSYIQIGNIGLFLFQEKDKRTRRHKVGLHIAVWPCGVIPDFAELFGSESISQVQTNAHIYEYLKELIFQGLGNNL